MPTSHGVVKWFNVSIGYGFITDWTNGSELFVHGNSCERGFLVNGEHVAFDVSDCVPSDGKPRNRQAVRVRANCGGNSIGGDRVGGADRSKLLCEHGDHNGHLVVTTPTIVC